MGLPRHISGERVFEALQNHPDGLHKPPLAELTGLSHNQIGVGLTWIREVAASEHTSPLTWTRQNGYQLSPGTETCEAYEYSQLRSKLVGMIRLMRGTISPHATLEPDNDWVRRAAHIVTATCDSLELLTNADGHPKTDLDSKAATH